MTIVVKVGGRVLKSNFERLLDSLAAAWKSGTRLVFVHGGGDQVTEFCQKLGIQPRFLVSPSGIRSRYTSWEELEVYLMVMAGLVNKRLVAGLLARGVKSVGLSGLDGALVIAERKKKLIAVDERGRKMLVEGGYTGKITSADASLIERLLELGHVPVIAPIAYGDGVPLNVDGDQMAARLAEALRTEALVLLTDVPGVFVNGSLVERLSPSEASLLAERVGPGMNRKLALAAEAVSRGVGRAVIASGLTEDPIGEALRGGGTVIVGTERL
ncbi:MAG: [LysW]-aminoadipate/[LysW]-glutamate kinase [Fervidicoccaceae archaeon]